MEASKPLEEKIKSLGLTSNIEQVMEEGYTIISPDKVAPEKFRNDLLNKIIEIAVNNRFFVFVLSLMVRSATVFGRFRWSGPQ